jgi:calcium permeable stress-gated cation channel
MTLALQVIYEPKVKYHVGNKQPPRISDSLFGWIPPLINTKEPELVDKIGLDAVAFLRFLRMFRYLFSCIAIVTCGVLIPINATYTIKNSTSKDDYDILSMLTIRDVSGQMLIAHVAVSYIITGLVMFFVYINWVQMVKLRHEWFRSPEYAQSFYARTLTILHVPKTFQSDEGLRAIFESTKVPYPTTAVHIGRKVGKLPELIEYHNTTVRELEQVLVRYLKGGKIAKERPTIRIGGWLGMGGQKRDAIEFYTCVPMIRTGLSMFAN